MGNSFTISAAVAAFAALLVPAAQAFPDYTTRVLVNNLANPRGLLVLGNQLLVSEAGSGGPALAGGTNCFVGGGGSQLCSGATGALGSWDLTSQTYSRLFTHLPSLAQSSGADGTGLADLTTGGPTGLLGVFGFGGDPSVNDPTLLGSNLFSQVVSIDVPTSTIVPLANLGKYEQSQNPDGSDETSNPYAVQVFDGKVYATDAGGNSLITLGLTPDPMDGTLPILGDYAFPPFQPPYITASAVPTGLAVNPSTNKLLIGQFGGFPFESGSARVSATDGLSSPVVSLTGFTSITDVAADALGNTYVLEYTSNLFDPNATGSIWRVNSVGDRRRIIDGLIHPTSLALGPDGIIFVSNNADGLQGEVREFRPTPAPFPLLGAALAWRQARRLRQRVRRSGLGSATTH